MLTAVQQVLLWFVILASVGAQAQQNVLDPDPKVPIVPKTIEDAYHAPNGTYGAWNVKQIEWTPAIETAWRNFVVSFGKSSCSTVDQCMKDISTNPYFKAPELKTFFYADCGRFPYLLRMYFSWKNNLPFTAIVRKTGTPEDVKAWVDQKILEGVVNPKPSQDYPTNSSENGNIMIKRFSIPSDSDLSQDFFDAAEYVINSVNTANYRFDAEREMPEQADFFPVDISPEMIVPGTVLYDPAGHIVTVYEVTPQGDIKFIDSHPDNSVSRGVYNKTFVRSRPAHGSGFKNFRPFTLENDTIKMIPNEEIHGFSLIQFYGNMPSTKGWSQGTFRLSGLDFDYYDYVRFRMATQPVKINPVEQFGKELGDMCASMQERSKDVIKPLEVGLLSQPHPDKLPKNIYNAAGDWEAFSTPGRDSRLKMSVGQILKTAQDSYTKVLQKHPYFSYQGGNYYADLAAKAQQVSQACDLSYTNSQGQIVKLDFLTATARLKKFSFDPYHCPERRWGASGAELSTCVESADQANWYEAEQVYRDQIERIQGDNMDDDLLSLQAKNKAHKPATWSSDVLASLKKLQGP